MTETLEIRAEGLENKLKNEIMAAFFLVFVSFCASIAAIVLCQDASIFASDVQMFRFIIPIVVLILAAFSLKMLIDMKTEQAVALGSGFVNLVLGPQELEGPISVLEGPTKDNLRRHGRSKFSIPWSSIEQFIVEPGRGRRSRSPPYFKVTIKGKKSDYDDGYFIRRQFFSAHEAKIVEFVRQKLGADQIILNDKLR